MKTLLSTIFLTALILLAFFLTREDTGESHPAPETTTEVEHRATERQRQPADLGADRAVRQPSVPASSQTGTDEPSLYIGDVSLDPDDEGRRVTGGEFRNVGEALDPDDDTRRVSGSGRADLGEPRDVDDEAARPGTGNIVQIGPDLDVDDDRRTVTGNVVQSVGDALLEPDGP